MTKNMSIEGIMANLSMEEIISNLTSVENITSGREGTAWKLNCDIKKTKTSFKGTVSQDGSGFWWHVWLFAGPNRGRGHF
jgi:hypothetical protein